MLADIITEAGAEIRCSTPTCQLAAAGEGVVTGVIMKSEEGVVLATGGMFYNTYPHNLNCLSPTRNCCAIRPLRPARLSRETRP